MAGSEDNVNMSNSFIPRPNQRRQTVWNIEGNVIIQGDPCTQVAMMSSDWIPESSELQTASSLNNEQIPAHGMHLFSPYEMDQLINTIPTWILPSLPHPILPAGSSRDNTSRPEYQIRPAVFRGPLIANQRQQPATDSYVESLELNDEDEPVR